MNDPQVSESTMIQPGKHLHYSVVVYRFGLGPPPESGLDALRWQAKIFEKNAKDKEYYAQNGPLGAFPGTHPRLREYLRARNQQRSFPTPECPCDSCTEYEDFIKVRGQLLFTTAHAPPRVS